MGENSKNKKDKASKKKSSSFMWLIAAAIIIITALAISGNLPFQGSQKESGKSFNLSGKEMRQVLDPAMFTGQIRMAYEAAQKYPEILNEVYCYCFCDAPPSNHKTLLSCFTDHHGAG